MRRAIIILAATVPLTFGTLAVGAVWRGAELGGEAWGAIAAILGAIVAGVFTLSIRLADKQDKNQGGKSE